MDLDLPDRRAPATGSSDGIGVGMAQRLAAATAGAALSADGVVVNGIG